MSHLTQIKLDIWNFDVEWRNNLTLAEHCESKKNNCCFGFAKLNKRCQIRENDEDEDRWFMHSRECRKLAKA